MKLLFLILTLVFCFSFVGSKNQVSFTSGTEYSESDSKHKIDLQLAPLLSFLLVIPEPESTYVSTEHSFSISFSPIVAFEICSQGPPAV